MKPRTLLALVASFVLVVPVAAQANNGKGGQPVYQVSGGGQLIADSHPGTGPGTTIAFTAQMLDNGGARGQLQYVGRGDDGSQRGRDQDRQHGSVTCVEPRGDNAAVFGGELRDGTPFRVDVIDNGQPVDGADMLVFRSGENLPNPSDPCDDDDEDEEDRSYIGLGRGNVKIHDRR